MTTSLKSIDELSSLLRERKDLATALEISIRQAGIQKVPDRKGFYALCQRMLLLVKGCTYSIPELLEESRTGMPSQMAPSPTATWIQTITIDTMFL